MTERKFNIIDTKTLNTEDKERRNLSVYKIKDKDKKKDSNFFIVQSQYIKKSRQASTGLKLQAFNLAEHFLNEITDAVMEIDIGSFALEKEAKRRKRLDKIPILHPSYAS